MKGRFRALPFALAIVLLFSGLANALEVQTATIVVQSGGATRNYETTARTVEDFIIERNIPIFEGDVITPAGFTPITNGLTISIERAFTVFVMVNCASGRSIVETTATAGTVFDFVANYSAVNGKYFVFDYSIGGNTLLPFMLIELYTVSEVESTTYYTIAYEQQTVYNSTIFVGDSRIAQQGVAGVRAVTENKIYEGSEIVFTRIVSDAINLEPIPEIVYIGTAPRPTPTPTPVPTPPPTSVPTPTPSPTPVPAQQAFAPQALTQPVATPRPAYSEALLRAINPPFGPTAYTESWRNYNGNEFYFTSVLTMQAFAYEAGPRSTGKRYGDPAFGVTHSGLPARVGVVAVDRNVIPFFTKLYIVGYGFAIAADTGTGINGNTIDLFFDTVAECLRFGVRDVTVYVIGHLGDLETARQVLYDINPVCLLYRHRP